MPDTWNLCVSRSARHEVAAHAVVELFPQFARRAQQRQREKRRVDERLLACGKVQAVGRGGVGGGVDRHAREFGEVRALESFGVGAAAEFEPRRETHEQPPQGFEVGVLVAVGRPRRGLHGHRGLETTGGQVFEHGRGELVSHAEPVAAVFVHGEGGGVDGEWESVPGPQTGTFSAGGATRNGFAGG